MLPSVDAFGASFSAMWPVVQQLKALELRGLKHNFSDTPEDIETTVKCYSRLLSGDNPARCKMGGHAIHACKKGCSCCGAEFEQVPNGRRKDGVPKSRAEYGLGYWEWEARCLTKVDSEHRENAQEWIRCDTAEKSTNFVSAHGSRYSAFMELSALDCSAGCPTEYMHWCNLGEYTYHTEKKRSKRSTTQKNWTHHVLKNHTQNA